MKKFINNNPILLLVGILIFAALIYMKINKLDNNENLVQSDIGNYDNGIYYAKVTDVLSGLDYSANVELYNNKVIKINAFDKYDYEITINPTAPSPVNEEGYCNITDDTGTNFDITIIEKLEIRNNRIAYEKKIADEEHAREVEENIKNQRIQDSLRETRTKTNHDGLLYNGETQDNCINCGGLITKNNESEETLCWVCKTEMNYKRKNLPFTDEDQKNFNEMRKILKKKPGYNNTQSQEWLFRKIWEYDMKTISNQQKSFKPNY